jgi:hypothetical protein
MVSGHGHGHRGEGWKVAGCRLEEASGCRLEEVQPSTFNLPTFNS